MPRLICCVAALLFNLSIASPTAASQQFENLRFSENACALYGNDDLPFDECAALELCQLSDDKLVEDDVRRRGRGRRRRQAGESNHQHGFGFRVHRSGGICSSPGPIVRLKRGTNHGLFFVNNSTRSSNLHLHGLHIGAGGAGDGGDHVLREIPSGSTGIYRIDLPSDQHMGGTHWYHPHLHGEAWEQTRRGAFGMIVVSDEMYDIAADVASDSDDMMHVDSFLNNEEVLVLDNTDKKEEVWRANGQASGEMFEWKRNEWYRLRILMVHTGSYSTGGRLIFGNEECEVRPIAHDGIFRFKIPGPPQTEYPLTSASRLDVAIKCQRDSSILVWDQEVAKVFVGEDGDEFKTPFLSGGNTWSSNRLEYLQDLRNIEIDDRMDIEVKETSINGKSLNQREPICRDAGDDGHQKDFAYGSVVEWTIRGAATHPFHSHIYPMQIVSDGCGQHHASGEFYDTIVTDDYNSLCKVRVKLVEVSGPAFVHCHIFQHAEQGAIAYFQVVASPNTKKTKESVVLPACVDDSCVDVEALPTCA